MAIIRCPTCGEVAVSCLPYEPVPQVVPRSFELRCKNGHVWTDRVEDEVPIEKEFGLWIDKDGTTRVDGLEAP